MTAAGRITLKSTGCGANVRPKTSMGTSRRPFRLKRPEEGESSGSDAAEYHPGVAARKQVE